MNFGKVKDSHNALIIIIIILLDNVKCLHFLAINSRNENKNETKNKTNAGKTLQKGKLVIVFATVADDLLSE